MKNSPVTKAILNLIPYKTNGYFRPNTNCSEGLGAGLVFYFHEIKLHYPKTESDYHPIG